MKNKILTPFSIDSEISYFKKMLEREKRTSDLDKALWKKETIRERQERISLEVFDLCNGTVKYGPFKGMKLSNETWWGKSDLGSQCLGLYEKEILDFIEKIPDYHYENFIDIGAADGYYAIGMLLAKKSKNSICYEISEEGRKTIKNNAGINNIEKNIQIKSEASIQSISALNEDLLKKSLIMIDIEGSEFDLLNEDVLEKFKNSTLLIEIHNWVDNFEEKYTKLLQNCFLYHSAEVISRTERPTLHLEELTDFTDDNRLLLTSERRPCVMRFLKLTPSPENL